MGWEPLLIDQPLAAIYLKEANLLEYLASIVDGMNVFKVIEAAYKAGKHVRSGKGPYILEVQTYRYRGHSMSDPAKYRSKKEVRFL